MKLKRTIRYALIVIILLVILVLTFGPGYLDKSQNKVLPHSPFNISQQAIELHQSLQIGDLHADTSLWKRDLLEKIENGHVDIPRLSEGNVAVQMFTAVTKVPAGINYEKNSTEARDLVQLIAILERWPVNSWSSLTQRALHQVSNIRSLEKEAPEKFKFILSAKDLATHLGKRATGSSIVGGMMGTEGSHALDGDLENIKVLFDAGYRMMSLHHFFDNKLGGSLHGESTAGLTEFGKQAVLKMNQLEVMIDVSHSSEAVVEDVLAITSRPLIVSHTGIRGHCDLKRNIHDPLMQKIAKSGGLIGVGYWEGAVCEATPKNIVAAIRYAIDLLGEDHVALGSDFDGATTTPFDTSELAILTEEMLVAGFTEIEIRKVMGANMMRYFAENLPAG